MTIVTTVDVTCPECGGHGEIDDPKGPPLARSYEDMLAMGPIPTLVCPMCGGRGAIPAPIEDDE